MAPRETAEETRAIDTAQDVYNRAVIAADGDAPTALSILCTAYAMAVAAAAIQLAQDRHRDVVASGARAFTNGAERLLNLPPLN